MTTRRNFLKGALAGAGLAVVGPFCALADRPKLVSVPDRAALVEARYYAERIERGMVALLPEKAAFGRLYGPETYLAPAWGNGS